MLNRGWTYLYVCLPLFVSFWFRMWNHEVKDFSTLGRIKSGSAELTKFSDNLKNLHLCLQSENPYANFVIMGDFNCHSQNWWADGDTTPEGKKIVELFTPLHLSQLISERTNFIPNPSCSIDYRPNQPHFVNPRIKKYKCTWIREFTDKFFNFQERHRFREFANNFYSFSRIHEQENNDSRFHEHRSGPHLVKTKLFFTFNNSLLNRDEFAPVSCLGSGFGHGFWWIISIINLAEYWTKRDRSKFTGFIHLYIHLYTLVTISLGFWNGGTICSP